MITRRVLVVVAVGGSLVFGFVLARWFGSPPVDPAPVIQLKRDPPSTPVRSTAPPAVSPDEGPVDDLPAALVPATGGAEDVPAAHGDDTDGDVGGYEDSGYEDSGFEDSGYEDSGYEDEGYEDEG